MFEDVVVDDGHVQDDEDTHEAEHDGPEEEFVAPHVVEELGVGTLGLGLHAEQAAAEVQEFPSEEETEPDLLLFVNKVEHDRKRGSSGTYHGHERRGSSTEHHFTSFVPVIAVLTEIPVAETVGDERKGR